MRKPDSIIVHSDDIISIRMVKFCDKSICKALFLQILSDAWHFPIRMEKRKYTNSQKNLKKREKEKKKQQKKPANSVPRIQTGPKINQDLKSGSHPLTYYFHMKTKILADFQICISAPLKMMKNTFYFTLKVVFFLNIFKFLP